MTRYWQHTFGEVYPNRKSPIPESDWTEVRVVPLDAIVIERSEMPEVRKHGSEGLDFRVEAGDNIPSGIYADESTSEGARGVAIAWLAIAEYLTANPPVDEDQVSALVAVISTVDEWGELNTSELAEALIATGKVTVTTDGGAS